MSERDLENEARSASPAHVLAMLKELRARRAQDLQLDHYEAVNLLWLLRVASRLGLDTGDWHHQLLNKLNALGYDSVSDANWGAEMTDAHVTTLLAVKEAPRDWTRDELGALSWARDLLSDQVACARNPFFVGVGEKAVATLDKILAQREMKP